MKLQQPNAELYIPDGAPLAQALPRTTDLCIAAHQDDIEIMAYAPIVRCYGSGERWFTGVVVTDGAGAPRSGIYGAYTDEDMKAVRAKEQVAAAGIGKYAAQFLLAYPSGAVKRPDSPALVGELREIILACAPETLYTHNLADKHDTHVAVALQVLRALRGIPAEKRPKKVVSMEVWRGPDWLRDEDKTAFDTGAHPNLAAALLGVYDSQIAGGKRYDLATIGRRLANATFFASHDVDETDSIAFGLDITALVEQDMDPAAFIEGYIRRFRDEVLERIGKLS
ncbi:MAG: PIG-L family deacetylase [Oscillospiraceae bacterium]|jgi:LmbE family N-acetylglucosaminyl deacetylase|nr:PIG-L family deacetylase [Oscillospiraceae bacterium]